MSKRLNSILETIGNTPVVRVNKLAPDHVNLFVKVESFNPMGSVKDRMAVAVIEDAERRGELQRGQTVVEATSGNTGIALAMVCAQKGYPLVIVMAENYSVERRKMIRYLGADVVLTPASAKGTGMVKKADELADKHGWWQPKQFENPANSEAHRATTAVEILETFSDIGLDYWVSGFGTGGTFSGVASVLRQQSPTTKIVVCEPDNSQILASGIKQIRNADGSHAGSHPSFRPHLMQGWSPDFVPALVEASLAESRIDEFVAVAGTDALRYSRSLATEEGIFAGLSAGATLAAAIEIATSAPEGSNILCMLPDTGERYLTTPMFDDIEEDMSDSEVRISKSTPGFRFDVTAPAAPKPSAQAADAVDMLAKEFVEQQLVDQLQPIVMFALEWCEFCWSVRKMFAKYGVDFRSIDLDAVAYQENNFSGKIRRALNDKTGWDTFPQIFIGGEFVGGCTDLFDACNNGKLQVMLEDKAIAYDSGATLDPYSLLPSWLHPR